MGLLPVVRQSGPLRFGSVDTLLPPCALIEGFLLSGPLSFSPRLFWTLF